MQLGHAPKLFNDEQHYARVEAAILDLQLSISSVRRANGCLDLDTVQRVRAGADKTLGKIDSSLSQFRPDPSQSQRLTERRRALTSLLREPAPIERLARTLHVG